MNLESYELKARKKLKNIPADKMDIVIDQLFRKIQIAQEANPNTSIKQIVKQFGPIEFVLNDILIANGISPIAPPKKLYGYLVIGIISFSLIFSLIIFLFIKKITPLIKIDEGANRISILGGMIDVDGTTGSINANKHFNMQVKTDHQFTGSVAITKAIDFYLNFKNAKLNIVSSQNNQLSWKCFLSSPLKENLIEQNDSQIKIQLEDYEGIHCDLKVPENIKLLSAGKNANINLLSPNFKSEFNIENFHFQFSPQINKYYNIQIDANSSLIDNYENIYSENGIELKIKGNNGRFQIL